MVLPLGLLAPPPSQTVVPTADPAGSFLIINLLRPFVPSHCPKPQAGAETTGDPDCMDSSLFVAGHVSSLPGTPDSASPRGVSSQGRYPGLLSLGRRTLACQEQEPLN